MAQRRLLLLVVGAGCTAILAILTRYVGIYLVLAGIVFLVSIRQTRAAVLLGVISSVAGLWLARNYVLTGTMMGPRLPSGLDWAEALTKIVLLMAEWAIEIGGIYAAAAAVCLLLRRGDDVHNRDGAD